MVWILEEASAPCGFMVAHALDRDWEIENLVIAPSARGRGFGTRLLLEMLHNARAQGAQTVFLEVRESNFAARALYRKCGFRESGRRPRYYCQPEEDAILYHLSYP
jgi:ribosomal-protein-alanine N-acetyltransferase